MNQKVKKYIDFLRNPTNYINNEKAICIAVNTLITETDAMIKFIDEPSRRLVNSIFPHINHIRCETNIAALLSNTHFVNINDLVQILIAKYLYIFNLLGSGQEQPAKIVKPKITDCNIKDIIDKEIQNMTLSKVLYDNNLFSDKPINYKVDPINKDQNLVSSLKNTIQPILSFTDRDLEVIAGRSALTIELFQQKKNFADEITKLMSSELLFNDTNQEIINNFQYLINKMFNDKIIEYIKSKGFSEDSIYFIYKGGTTMKILYDKYKSLLPNNHNLFSDYMSCFGRSDADYGIYINQKYFNTFDTYNAVLCDLNKISFNILNQIQDILSNNLECICPLDNIKDNELNKILNNLNKILNVSDRDKSLPDFKDIDKFIGITFNNKDYFIETIPKNLTDKDIHNLNITTTQTSSKNYDPNMVSNKDQIKRDGRINSAKNNFIIKIYNNNKPGEPKISPAICAINKPPNPNGIYYYFNETNKFSDKLLGSSILSEFNLHRLKINTVIYYVTKYGQYGYFNCPSELVDVTISNLYDGKIQNLDFGKILKKYKNKKVEFYSYSLYGFIDDLYKALFYEAIYPWDISKYKKKINRVIILLFIYINNKFNNTKVLYDRLIAFFNNLANNIGDNLDSFQLNEKATNNKYTINNDVLIYKLYSNILSRYQLIKADTNLNSQKDNMQKFIDMIQLINKIISSFKPEDIISGYNDNIESVPFMDKYLKYKQKYFALLKKLDKL